MSASNLLVIRQRANVEALWHMRWRDCAKAYIYYVRYVFVYAACVCAAVIVVNMIRADNVRF